MPLTLLLQPNFDDELWIDIWSAFPYATYEEVYNQYFFTNDSFLYEKKLVPKMTNLDGMQVTGALMHYPPYTAHYSVVENLHFNVFNRF